MCHITPECDSFAIECNYCGNDIMSGSCENGRCIECDRTADWDGDDDDGTGPRPR